MTYIPVDGDEYVFPFGTYFDTKLKADCNVHKTADGKQRCLPTATSVNYYSNGTCTIPLGTKRLVTTGTATLPSGAVATCVAPISEPTPIKDGYWSGSPNCYGVHVFYGTGASYSGNLYVSSGNYCYPSGTTAGDKDTMYFSLGPEIPLNEFVEVVVANE